MKAEDSDKLAETLRVVAQRQAFVFSEELDVEEAEPPSEEGLLFLAAISFSGPSSGTVKLAMPESVCDLVAENILGLEGGQAASLREEAKDVIGELLNVLCGQFLTAVEGDKPVFNLSVPHMRELEETDWNSLREEPCCRAISIEGSPVLVSLEL